MRWGMRRKSGRLCWIGEREGERETGREGERVCESDTQTRSQEGERERGREGE
jgi:hypothetical protein